MCSPNPASSDVIALPTSCGARSGTGLGDASCRLAPLGGVRAGRAGSQGSGAAELGRGPGGEIGGSLQVPGA